MQEITQEFVKSLFTYRDGILYWKVNKNYNAKIGNKVGYLHHTGYYQTKINGKSYSLHRLIFLYHHGYLPKIIDHKDRNSLNNNIENLRSATKNQNQWNKESYKHSSSIYKGVSWHSRDKIWQTRIRINNKELYLGSFSDEWTAAFIYNVYARGLHNKYAVLNNLGKKYD